MVPIDPIAQPIGRTRIHPHRRGGSADHPGAGERDDERALAIRGPAVAAGYREGDGGEVG